MSLLKGKHVLVTGGANGIGKAIVLQSLEYGAKVSFLDKDSTALESLKEELALRQAIGFYCDIRSRSEIEEIMKSIYFPVDILVNNAGVNFDFNFTRSLSSEANWDKVIDTNLKGTRYVTELILPSMVALGRGSVIFITSVHTAFAFPGGAAYDASKHALVGLMRVLALEYGPAGIRFNAIAPGSIYPAGRTGEMDDEQRAEFGKKIPLGRLGTPNDVARVVVFLASDMADYINGAEIRVDGGLSIKNSFV